VDCKAQAGKHVGDDIVRLSESGNAEEK